MVRHDMLDRMEMSAMADDAFMESNLDEDEAFIDLMVRRFAKRHPRIVNALKEAGYTQEDAHAWMKDLATGEMTVDEMRATLKDAMQDLEKEGVVREATDEQDSIETEQATGERETDTTTIETEQDTIEQEVVEIEARDLCVDETDKDSCYNERAAETNDATHCTSIQAQDTKDNCLSMVAINTKNDALCTDVVDNEVRTVCEQNIRSDNRITGDMILITD
ncbi:hypothetical protein HY492_00360 [Candidatus Woesearchaeota archaeon]|nr:hypothetical protein [Candidatus Woesearchaeota archaeon]